MALAACAPKGPRIPGPLSAVRDPTTGPGAALPPRPVTEEAPVRPAPAPPTARWGARLAAAAEAMLGGRVPRGFRDDCSGFVAAAAERVGIVLEGGTADLHAAAEADGRLHHRKEPHPGDLVFFDRTYDKDRNGRFDDALTHVGIVLRTLGDGTVELAHRSDTSGLSVLRMNLRHENDPAGPDGQVWNQPLRRARGERDAVLAGQLWRAFASPPAPTR